MPIFGSSGKKDGSGEWQWGVTESTGKERFTERWSEWSRRQHERFNWIAGDELRALGYAPQEFETVRGAWRAVSGLWRVGDATRRAARRLPFVGRGGIHVASRVRCGLIPSSVPLGSRTGCPELRSRAREPGSALRTRVLLRRGQRGRHRRGLAPGALRPRQGHGPAALRARRPVLSRQCLLRATAGAGNRGPHVREGAGARDRRAETRQPALQGAGHRRGSRAAFGFASCASMGSGSCTSTTPRRWATTTGCRRHGSRGFPAWSAS
jgi:hypothetical protein